ncbi:hypothetical protein DM47_3095 [Burkholderia mallei]|nr:hypothetical protein DM49_3864 [Burkholderia mallei]KOT19860.1 hypothetical protein DM47_3095 [Burkholderia mallei]
MSARAVSGSRLTHIKRRPSKSRKMLVRRPEDGRNAYRSGTPFRFAA